MHRLGQAKEPGADEGQAALSARRHTDDLSGSGWEQGVRAVRGRVPAQQVHCIQRLDGHHSLGFLLSHPLLQVPIADRFPLKFKSREYSNQWDGALMSMQEYYYLSPTYL